MARTAPVIIGPPIDDWAPRVDPSLSPEQHAQQHVHEAIRTCVQLMRHSDNKRITLDAAKEVLDRGLGKAVARVANVGAKDPLGIDAARAAVRELLTDPAVRAQVRAALRGEEIEA